MRVFMDGIGMIQKEFLPAVLELRVVTGLFSVCPRSVGYDLIRVELHTIRPSRVVSGSPCTWLGSMIRHGPC